MSPGGPAPAGSGKGVPEPVGLAAVRTRRVAALAAEARERSRARARHDRPRDRRGSVLVLAGEVEHEAAGPTREAADHSLIAAIRCGGLVAVGVQVLRGPLALDVAREDVADPVVGEL